MHELVRRRFDAVELELLWRRLISLVDEAAAALVRTSFSTVVRESHDFSCIVTDAAGESLVQATESIPSFIGTLPATVKHFLRSFPAESLAPGDVLITNDLWLGTGHLPDITVAKPIFRGARHVAFSASTAHAPDIGGKIRSAHKFSENDDIVYNLNDPSLAPLSMFPLKQTVNNFYNGSYKAPPAINYSSLINFYNSNTGAFSVDPIQTILSRPNALP